MSFVLLGEPATGKSSMLVALYGGLVNHCAGDLRLVRTIDEVGFLSRGLLAFGQQESLQRTDVGSTAQLLVEVTRGDEIVPLEVPDRSGELLKQMLNARAWDPDLREQISVAVGAMLFIRADRYDPGEPSHEVAELLTPGADDDEPHRHDDDPVAWTPALMPSDVRAVDLLQVALDDRDEALPVAIMISAWDRVSAPAPAPPSWLAQHMPLLDQYLDSNVHRLPHTVFGVSAQGGDFSAGLPAEVVEEDPWDRAFVVCSDGTRGTLADPVVWLLDAR